MFEAGLALSPSEDEIPGFLGRWLDFRPHRNLLSLVLTVSAHTPCLCLSPQNNAKVAVLGASGGIGQPLSLLLKNSPLVSRLTLYDIAHTPGVGADLSHIETRAHVKGAGARGRTGAHKHCVWGTQNLLQHPIVADPKKPRGHKGLISQHLGLRSILWVRSNLVLLSNWGVVRHAGPC